LTLDTVNTHVTHDLGKLGPKALANPRSKWPAYASARRWCASTTCPAATSPPARTPTCSPASSARSRAAPKGTSRHDQTDHPHTPPEEIMSSFRPFLERNRVFATTGAHAGLAMKQLFGQRVVQSCEGRRVRPLLEVLP
jgi:hypothetical protein